MDRIIAFFSIMTMVSCSRPIAGSLAADDGFAANLRSTSDSKPADDSEGVPGYTEANNPVPTSGPNLLGLDPLEISIDYNNEKMTASINANFVGLRSTRKDGLIPKHIYLHLWQGQRLELEGTLGDKLNANVFVKATLVKTVPFEGASINFLESMTSNGPMFVTVDDSPTFDKLIIPKFSSIQTTVIVRDTIPGVSSGGGGFENFLGDGFSLTCAAVRFEGISEWKSVNAMNRNEFVANKCGQCDFSKPVPPFHFASYLKGVVETHPCKLVSSSKFEHDTLAPSFLQSGSICSRPVHGCFQQEFPYPEAKKVYPKSDHIVSSWIDAIAACTAYYDPTTRSLVQVDHDPTNSPQLQSACSTLTYPLQIGEVPIKGCGSRPLPKIPSPVVHECIRQRFGATPTNMCDIFIEPLVSPCALN